MQFDVHENRGEGRERAPYLIDLQSDRVAALRMRVVAPLFKPEFLRPLDRLHPRLEVLEEPYTLLFRSFSPSINSGLALWWRILTDIATASSPLSTCSSPAYEARAMAEQINLRRARKARARAEKEKAAAASRARHGRAKADKRAERARAELAQRMHEGHRREHESDA